MAPWPWVAAGQPYVYGLCYAVDFRLQLSRRFQPSSQASVLALVATWATDFNTDLGCCWDMDPDMCLTQEFDLVNILAPSGIPGNSDQDGSGSSMAQGHQQDHRL